MTCPKAYYEKRITKSVVEETSPEMAYGTWVHKQFEYRQGPKKVLLPEELFMHEPFMQRLEAVGAPGDGPANIQTERKVALDRKMRPCGFFDDSVWWSGVIDFTRISRPEYLMRAKVVDFKTGRQKPDFRQLKLFALYLFAEGADVVDTMFYWTKTLTTTREVYSKDQAPELWKEIIPDLKRYVEAFKTENFPPKPSGLCYGWCPCTSCEYWRPKK
jgi:hypothetical protein